MEAIRDPRTWDFNGYFGGNRTITLEPGKLDIDAQDVFMRGHCHSLALALAELIPGAEIEGRWEYAVLEHVFVRLPDNYMLDANGVAAPECSRPGRWFDRIPDDIDWAAEKFREPRKDDAMPFARALIEREEIVSPAIAA